jgi:hypothetical protein
MGNVEAGENGGEAHWQVELTKDNRPRGMSLIYFSDNGLELCIYKLRPLA